MLTNSQTDITRIQSGCILVCKHPSSNQFPFDKIKFTVAKYSISLRTLWKWNGLKMPIHNWHLPSITVKKLGPFLFSNDALNWSTMTAVVLNLLEWFLKDHVTLKTGVMADESSASSYRNKLDFKILFQQFSIHDSHRPFWFFGFCFE